MSGTARGGCQTYVTGNKIFPVGEKCCIMCVGVIELWAHVIGTGRYDNISFRIKATFEHCFPTPILFFQLLRG